MKKGMYCKVFAVGIIVLFIGVSVSSGISINKPFATVDNENDCSCNEIDDKHLLLLEKQLNRLEISSKLLFVLSKYNPELKEISEELTNIISVKESFLGRPICNILFSIFLTLNESLINLWELQHKLEQFNFLYQILESISAVLLLTYSLVGDMSKLLVCDWVDW